MRRLLVRAIWIPLFVLLFTARPLLAQNSQALKSKVSAIQVEMIQSEEIKLPAEFKIALYENLIRQLGKEGFSQVYRDGDTRAGGMADLVVLHSTVSKFKEGSERARQVTTFTGATSITIHCRFTKPDGEVLLERDVNGKVRFFGGNLRATHDFAKKAARLTGQNFTISSK